MNIDKKLLEKQIKVLALQLNKDITKKERDVFEGLLNMLGDIADKNHPPKVLVTIQDGCVQHISSNDPDIQILTVDYDNESEERVSVNHFQQADNIIDKPDFYKAMVSMKESDDRDDKEAYKKIKELKF